MTNFGAWVPVRLRRQSGVWRLQWRRLGAARFTDPFFAQTIDACVAHPANLLFTRETGVGTLRETAARSPGLPPTAFIFHMSRCGSTLITQMLAALERNIVISEARPIDDVLRAHLQDPALEEPARLLWLQWLVSVLGRRRFPAEAHLFIKFDCWHSLFLPLIRRAFPGVPWLFVYRQPVEVLASQSRHRGAHMIPGVLEPALFGWDPAAVAAMDLDEYGARVLAAVGEAALSAAQDGSGEFLDYSELPQAVFRRFLPRWNPGLTEAELERAATAALLNAKNPILPFEPDSARKRGEAGERLRELSRRWLEPVYARLDQAGRR